MEGVGGSQDYIEVSGYSGHTYAQRPDSFRWRGVGYEVVEIEKEWLEPGLKCFQVRTADGKLFRLCYNEAGKEWLLR